MDFEKTDRLLSRVEEAFSKLIGMYALRGVTVERWRWDEPAITLAWSDPDKISRNVHAVIENEDTQPNIVIEANAWQDEDEEEGTRRARYWKHQIITSVKSPDGLGELGHWVEQAYKLATTWTRASLVKVYLSPWPVR